MAQQIEDSILSEARAEVSHADQKASMVLATLGIGFGALIGGFLAGNWRPSQLANWAEALWWAGIAMGAVSIVFAAAAVWPRYRRPDPDQVDKIHYWGDVAAFENVKALCDHLDTHTINPSDRTREQMWQLSRIVSRKYQCVRWSFIAAAVSAALFALAAVSKL